MFLWLFSAALPKMSRSRSASCSPSRAEQKTPASRKLILVSSTESIDQSADIRTKVQLSPSATDANPPSNLINPNPAHLNKESQSTINNIPSTASVISDNPSASVLPVSSAYSELHHQSAVTIQAAWRGYRTRNLDPAITSLKQELRCRRLEETVAFLLSEMNRYA